MPAQASAAQCVFPHSTKTSVDELVASIRREFRCGLPWAAVKTAVSNPDGLRKLRAAYQDALARHPDQTHYVLVMSHVVDAAAGHPEAMRADSEASIAAHPEDKTLLNAACWVRGARGVDLEHAMPYCDGAVAAGRPSYALANRGLVELQLGNFGAALHDYNDALADKNYIKDAYCAHAIYGRGIARLRLGDAGGADDLKYARSLSYSAPEEFEGVGLKP